MFSGQPGVTGPDLFGYQITEIVVLGTAYPQTSPVAFEANLQFSFYGQRVPTPGVAAVLLMAGVTAHRRRPR